MPLPYVLGATVTLSDVAQANLTVTFRNERTSETLTAITNSSGRALADASNFTSGYTYGDIITAFVNYTDYESSETHTTLVTEGGYNYTLALAAVPAVGALRYINLQDVYDHFGLTTTDISANQMLDMAIRTEFELDDELNTRFDSANSVTDEYHDRMTTDQVDYFLEHTPVQTLSKFEVNKSAEGQEESWVELVATVLDACDATTGWSATTDGEITLNSTVDENKEGDGCLNLIKSGATQTSVTFSKAMTSADFSDRDLILWFYLESMADLVATGSTAVEIRYGSSSSAYDYKQYDRSDLGTGWNSLSFRRTTATGTTGSPTVSECDYFAIIITYAAATTTVAAPDMRIDHIRLGESYDLDVDYETGRVRVTASVNDPEVGARQVRATYTWGRSSVPSIIEKVVVLMVGRMLMKSAIGKALMVGRDEFNPTTFNALDADIERILRRYRRMWIGNT